MMNYSRSAKFDRTLLAGASSAAIIAAALTAPASAAAQGQNAATQNAPSATVQSPAPGIETDDTPVAGEVVVTGRRRAIESAIRRKERADSIIDSVVADDAGKLPDNSITEVLQRVPGVAIVRFAALGDPDRFSVEGSGVQVRGLSGVQTRLNGREIFGANSGRSLSFGDVTPELMAAVDVYKSPTADLIEGGTGGQIDLRTKMPFDFKKPSFLGTVGLSRGDLARKADPSASFLITDRFDTSIGEIGVLLDVAYSKFSSNTDFIRMEPYQRTRIGSQDYFIPAGYDYGEDDYSRKRIGLYGAVQWAPTPDLTFAGTFFQSRYKDDNFGRGAFVVNQNLALDPATSEFDDIGGLIRSSSLFVRNPANFTSGGTIGSGGNTTVSLGDTVTRDLSASFQYTSSSPLALAGAVQFVRSKAKRDAYSVFRALTFPGTFGLDLSGDLPEVSVPAAGQAAFSNPASYAWEATMPHNDLNRGKQFAANLDAEYKFETEGFFKSAKVGARLADRRERDLGNGYNWSALGRGWNGSPQLTFADAREGDVSSDAFDNFFRGEVSIPGELLFPSEEMVGAMDRAGDHAYYGGADYIVGRDGLKFTDRDRSFNRTKTKAAYALVRLGSAEGAEGMGWKANVGARLVNVKNRSEGFFTHNATTFVRDGVYYRTLSTESVREGGGKFTYVLPAMNVQLLPQPDIHLRFAYSKTLDNPGFGPLRTRGSAGVETETLIVPPGVVLPCTPADTTGCNPFRRFTADTGNPNLTPATSRNLDFSAEWYPKQGTSAHVALFHKRIKNLLVYTVAQRPVEFTYSSPASAGTVIETAEATDVDNADETATVKGVELGGQTFFDMLPGFFSGLGLQANYTFIDSKNPGDRYFDIDGRPQTNLPITGLSKHNFNVTGMYEKGPISARVAYSWRSRYLMTTTGNGTNGSYNYFSAPGVSTLSDISLPIYSEPYGAVDAGIRFKFNDHFSLGLDANNILNETAKTSMGGYPEGKRYVRSWYTSDRRVGATLNVAF